MKNKFLINLFALIFCFNLNAITPETIGIIFDCDGVLVDTEYTKFLAWQEILKNHNISFTLEEYLPLIGYPSSQIIQKIMALKNISLNASNLSKERHDLYRLLQSKGVSQIASAVNFVQQLANQKHKHNIVLGLASSAPLQEIMINLQHIGLVNNIFDVIISGHDDLTEYNDPNGVNKPKPYIYQKAAKLLGIKPSKCLVFEDTNAGITAATNAGMLAIAIPNNYTKNHDFSMAHKIYNDFDNVAVNDLLAIVQNSELNIFSLNNHLLMKENFMSNTTKIGNVIVPVITPEDKNDFPALIEHILAGGIKDLVLFGTTGEGSKFDLETKEKIVKELIPVIARRARLFTVLFGKTQEEIIEWAKFCNEQGFTGALLSLDKANDEQFLSKLLAATKINIIIYNTPSSPISDITKINENLFKNNRIIGIKDSSGNLELLKELLKFKSDRFKVFYGRESQIEKALLLNIDGIVPSTGNVDPSLILRLWEKKDDETLLLVKKLKEQINNACHDSYAQGIKNVLKEKGIIK